MFSILYFQVKITQGGFDVLEITIMGTQNCLPEVCVLLLTLEPWVHLTCAESRGKKMVFTELVQSVGIVRVQSSWD